MKSIYVIISEFLYQKFGIKLGWCHTFIEDSRMQKKKYRKIESSNYVDLDYLISLKCSFINRWLFGILHLLISS